MMNAHLVDIESNTSLEKEVFDIFVFTTNINNREDVEKMGVRFNDESRILKWNVDIEDIDKVLRIEAQNISFNEIQQLMRTAGYHCDELRD